MNENSNVLSGLLVALNQLQELKGKIDPEIGELLGISRRTVEKHLENIYQKLGVETRTSAVISVLEK